jgi:prephenate dehydratase
MIIGISGAPGSFSEQAAIKFSEKNSIKNPEIDFLVSVENVLTKLEMGQIDYGVFPIENSIGGIVIEAVHAMAPHQFKIKELFEIEVNQNLLVMKGKTASDITAIASHDQALKQCRMYLKRMWENIDLQPYADTALAAKDLSEGKLPQSTAVVASMRAAEMYGLDVLDEKIQDLKFNYTVFVAAEKFVPQ